MHKYLLITKTIQLLKPENRFKQANYHFEDFMN